MPSRHLHSSLRITTLRLIPLLFATLLLLTLGACGGGGHDNPPGQQSGGVAVNISGLPAGTNAAVTLSGPGSYSRALTGSDTVAALPPGSYTVAASNVVVDSGAARTTYIPAPASQAVTVSAGATASASVAYSMQAALALTLQQVASGLSAPVFLSAPDGDARLFVVERTGRIRIIDQGQVLATPLLDISTSIAVVGEGGLLSMAFDPRFSSNGYFYVAATDLAGNLNIVRYSMAAGSSSSADPLSAVTILSVAHPTYTNHYGGLVSFGPDGYLYLGTGDGGGAGDPNGNAQNTNALLGKLLRLDVRNSTAAIPYVIPADNPFAGQAGKRAEIWAYGLRNPWRYAFDASSARLLIADVGQANSEEIDSAALAQAGNNYGWNIMEATQCYLAPGCNQAGLVLPIFSYAHGVNAVDGCSITGGYVYRGAALPELAGRYLYSDYCAGWLKSINGDAGPATDWGIGNVGNIVSFGRDGVGELYLLSGNGAVYRIVRK